ncbi:hypothetical protein HY024_00965 [Candidatus Curtissbacteria bacterium]|nr:hypothetical protein [Candidatus Curtissbacteria bacterium]
MFTISVLTSSGAASASSTLTDVSAGVDSSVWVGTDVSSEAFSSSTTAGVGGASSGSSAGFGNSGCSSIVVRGALSVAASSTAASCGASSVFASSSGFCATGAETSSLAVSSVPCTSD